MDIRNGVQWEIDNVPQFDEDMPSVTEFTYDIPMKYLFPGLDIEKYADRPVKDRVYREHVREFGAYCREQKMAIVSLDVESGRHPEPVRSAWLMQDPETRPGAVQNRIEMIDAFQEGYEGFGKVTMAWIAPNWVEYERVKDTRSVSKQWEVFNELMAWEQDIEPLVDKLDFALCDHYNKALLYLPTGEWKGNSLEDYLNWWEKALANRVFAVENFHKAQGQFLINLGNHSPDSSDYLPGWVLKRMLKALSQHNWPVSYWIPSSAEVTDYQKGMIEAFAGKPW